MAGNDEGLGGSRRLGAEDRRWSSTSWVLGGRMIGRSGDAVCSLYLHKETRNASFLVWPQNQHRRFVTGLVSKPLGQVSWFGLKTKVGGLSVVWPQNH
jgi:hypothetical protein